MRFSTDGQWHEPTSARTQTPGRWHEQGRPRPMSRKTRWFLRIEIALVLVLIATWAIKYEIVDVEKAKSVLSEQIDDARTEITEQINAERQ